MLRVVRRAYDQAVKVPAELTGELTRATVTGVGGLGGSQKSSDRFDADLSRAFGAGVCADR